jgi:hypothetical protein
MKPRIFIGSSTERLDIAYAIQENLDRDSQATVWTQGIFKLSNSSLDSLLLSLEKFDFAIFVFHPDDITQIRENTYDTVRDNLIFELGLFIGRLGKDKVFFLIPRTVDKLHLPTDLLGITPGTYDNYREDGNLIASLAPFCNQIRNRVKDFIYENIEDIQNEPQFIKSIVIEKKIAWEHLFAAELLAYRLVEINNSYLEIETNSAVLRFKPMTGREFFDWFLEASINMEKFIHLFTKCLDELNASFGPLGIAGKPIEIKNAVERFILLCRELLNIEYELYRISPLEELDHVKQNLKNWTKLMFIDEIIKLHKDMKSMVILIRNGDTRTKFSLTLTPTIPSSVLGTIGDFRKYLGLE